MSFKKYLFIPKGVRGNVDGGTLYIVAIMVAIVGFGAVLTKGIIPPTTQPSGAAVTIIPPNPKPGQKNLQLYTFGFISGIPTQPPTRPPTQPPTVPPTLTLSATPVLTATPTPTPPIVPTLPTLPPTPTVTPSARCPLDSIKTPGCGACFPEVESLACDEPTCDNGQPKMPLSSDPFGTKYCIYMQPINPVLYGAKSSDPDCLAACIAKPVIYLYPEEPTLVNVKVKIPGEIFISDPLYPENGWQNVLANPDGSLVYNNKKYKELFYESYVDRVNPPDNGIIIPYSQLKKELSEAITKLGLQGAERDEFIDFWIPVLNKFDSPYILFSILDPIEKERLDHVEISPKPDTFITFIAYFKPLQKKPTDLKPLILPKSPPERKGFTAVEWGGTIGE